MASCDPDDSDGVLLLELEDELRKVFREVINTELKTLVAAFTDQARRDLHEVAADVKRDLHDVTVEVKHDLRRDFHSVVVGAIATEGGSASSPSSGGAGHQLRRQSSPRTAWAAPQQDHLPPHPQQQHAHGKHQEQHEKKAEKPRPPMLQHVDGAAGPDRKGPMEWCHTLSAGSSHGFGLVQRRTNSQPNEPPHLPIPGRHKYLAKPSSPKELFNGSRRTSISSTSSAPDPSMVRKMSAVAKRDSAASRYSRGHHRGGSQDLDSLPAEENHVWMGRHRKCYIRGMEDLMPKHAGTPKGAAKSEEEARQVRRPSKPGLFFSRASGSMESLPKDSGDREEAREGAAGRKQSTESGAVGRKQSTESGAVGRKQSTESGAVGRKQSTESGAVGRKQSTEAHDVALHRKSAKSDGGASEGGPGADQGLVLGSANSLPVYISAPKFVSPPPVPPQAPPALPCECEVTEVGVMQFSVPIPASDTRSGSKVHPAAPAEATDTEEADQATKSATSDSDEESSQGSGHSPAAEEEQHRPRLHARFAAEIDTGSAAESPRDKHDHTRGARSSSLTGSTISSCSLASSSPGTAQTHEEDAATTPGGSLQRSRSKQEKLFTKNNVLLRRGSMTSVVDQERHGTLSRWVKSLRSATESVVTDDRFDYVVGICIILNAVTMGVQTEYAAISARDQTDEPEVLPVLSSVFCFIFTAELLLRAFVFGRTFFTVPEWRWNLFDTGVVAMQLAEELISFCIEDDEGETSQVSLSFVRILRGLRLVRIVRIVRIMHLLRELRSMVGSVICTFRSLLWTMVMLLLIIYIAGVYLTQQVATYGSNNPDGVAEGTALHKHFGGIMPSIMSLFQAISGGIDWMELTDPLMAEISPFMGLMFALFISFTIFSMLNVVTGIFVESALKNTREETDIDMVNHLYKVFGEACVPEEEGGFEGSRITLEEFEGQLENPRLQAYFRSIDLDLSEARGLFELLDIDEIGSIDVEDFVMGCLRLRGPAKSIDLATLMSETRRMKCQWRAHMNTVEVILGSIAAGGQGAAGGEANGGADGSPPSGDLITIRRPHSQLASGSASPITEAGAASAMESGASSPSFFADEKSGAEGHIVQAPAETPVAQPLSQFMEPAPPVLVQPPRAFFPRRKSVGPYAFPELRASGNT